MNIRSSFGSSFLVGCLFSIIFRIIFSFRNRYGRRVSVTTRDSNLPCITLRAYENYMN
ncbi:hypothetical protein Hanom_Chr03g00210341 [Helianthus anomalus]